MVVRTTVQETFTEDKIWIAHSRDDKNSAQMLGEWLDRQMMKVLNDYVAYKVSSGEEIDDVTTSSIEDADFVLALLSNQSREDDLVSQLRRAKSYSKPILVVFDEALSNIQFASNDLARLLSTRPHVYMSSKQVINDLLMLIRPERAHHTQAGPSNKPDAVAYDIFISKKSQDYSYAEALYRFLEENKKVVFLSEASLPKLGNSEYMKAIDEALEHSRHMIVLGSSADYLMSGWVEAEWRVFLNEKRSGRKKGNLVTVIANEMKISEVPMSLRYYEVVPYKDAFAQRFLDFLT
jgi:hypothetical protein